MKRLRVIALSAALLSSLTNADTTLLKEGGLFPEGALVLNDRYYFVELMADQLSVVKNGEPSVLWHGGKCFPSSVINHNDGLLMACSGASKLIQLDAQGNELWQKHEDQNGVAFKKPNDLTQGMHNDIWFTASGSEEIARQPEGQVFHLTEDGTATLVAEGLSYANGIAMTHDGSHLLVGDMFNNRILSYAIQGQTLGTAKVWADLKQLAPNAEGNPPPYPDGMEFGPDGNLYVAIWGGKKIAVLSPEGRLVRLIQTPLVGTTNLSFLQDGRMLVTGVHDISGPPFAGDILIMDAK